MLNRTVFKSTQEKTGSKIEYISRELSIGPTYASFDPT